MVIIISIVVFKILNNFLMFMKMSFAKISSYTSAAETTPLQPNNNNNNVNNVRHSCILSKTL